MNQTLEEAPETGRVKKSIHHPTPQRLLPLAFPWGFCFHLALRVA